MLLRTTYRGYLAALPSLIGVSLTDFAILPTLGIIIIVGERTHIRPIAPLRRRTSYKRTVLS
jgi:hypothetical protein